MTHIEETKKELGHLGLSDKEIEEVCDIGDAIAEIIIRGYWDSHKQKYDSQN